jgi:hypothetical protein
LSVCYAASLSGLELIAGFFGSVQPLFRSV